MSMHKSIELTTTSPIKPPKKIIFYIEDAWLIEINKNGIQFNTEGFPSYTPDDFAWHFMHTLEYNYDVKFTKKEENEHA